MSKIRTLASQGTLTNQDVQEKMTFIHADCLRQEKVLLNKLSDDVYGHVDRKVLEDIHDRIQEINDWLSHLEYV